MLTFRNILKVGRLLGQTGEPRDGYLNDETDNLEGRKGTNHSGVQSIAAKGKQLKPRGPGKEIEVSLAYHEDATTGDVRIVKR